MKKATPKEVVPITSTMTIMPHVSTAQWWPNLGVTNMFNDGRDGRQNVHT